jgi:hypothetical protein
MQRSIKVKIIQVRRRLIHLPGIRGRCAVCRRQVEIMPEAQAIEILQVGSHVFDEQLAEGMIHAIQTVSGNLWICKDSLFQCKPD